MIDVVMVAYKRPEYTFLAIQYLLERTKDIRVIVVENEASPFSIHPFIEHIKLSKNYGLERAKNIGLCFVESGLYIDTDNDLLCSYYWLPRLVALMKKYPDYAAISCRPQVLVGAGDVFGQNKSEVVERDHVGGSLRIMRTNVVRSVGGWRNENTSRAEEHYICGKLRQAGYKVGYSRDVRCWHIFGKNWGYKENEEHGHREIYPPVEVFDNIKVNPETFEVDEGGVSGKDLVG